LIKIKMNGNKKIGIIIGVLVLGVVVWIANADKSKNVYLKTSQPNSLNVKALPFTIESVALSDL